LGTDPFCRAIQELPDYLDEVLRNIQTFTGLSASIMVGGPMPQAGGALSTSRYGIYFIDKHHYLTSL